MVTSVTSTSTAATTTSSTSSTSSSSSDSSLISSDFQTFLVMLTTQMQNQDPLNPIESTEYATQLAQFSQVEQSVKTNDLLEGLATQLSSIGMSQLAGWVGMEARSTAPAYFDGTESVALAIEPASGADQTVLVVYDASGNEVQAGEIANEAGIVEWDGTDADGNVVDPGLYTFKLENYQNGALLSPTDVES